jgi:hypothetical protein
MEKQSIQSLRVKAAAALFHVLSTGFLCGVLFFASLSCVGFADSKSPAKEKRSDWLIDSSRYKAEIKVHEQSHEIELSNGLVRRMWRLQPDAATVAFDNPMTGESMLRGVKPEAIIRIHGVDCKVGGLVGQPNYAYLLPKWLNQMQADPTAFKFDRYDVGKIQERFGWKRVRPAGNLPWPPPGTALTLYFKATPDLVQQLTREQTESSEHARKLLLSDDFESLSNDWQVHKSPQEGTSFSLEGKPGAIVAPANTTVFSERDLPKGVRIVQCSINAGTDQGNSWGPGIALVWPDRTVKFYVRSDQKRFGVFDGSQEHLLESVDTSVTQFLRIRIEGDAILCEASPDTQRWHSVHTIKLNAPVTDPVAVRLGKTSQTGQANDHPSAGQTGRCVVDAFRAYGDLTDEARALRTSEMAFVNNLTVAVHYEMYDGIPLMAKWLAIQNASKQQVPLESFTSEILAVVEYESVVDERQRWEYPNLHVESDYEFTGMDAQTANRVVNWVPDPQYGTQVNYLCRTPNLLEVKPPIGPDVQIKPGETFETFRTFILVQDSTERIRKGLALRRMYRTVAPWVTENPLIMHVSSSDPNAVRQAIDQCVETGYEMVIMTFGSGFNIENESPEYLQQIKELVQYSNERKVELGGYTLLASRSINPDNDVVSPAGKHAVYGSSPCIGSQWGQDYFRKLYQFCKATGFNLVEHDGSYPGDVCASTKHPGHRGLYDSQWEQWKTISEFYKWCRGNGIYLNVPDYYFLVGSNKVAMGYRETNWSLPREQQVIHTRQNIYDGTWQKTPSMGWMFVPLTQYHGGGAAATIEPLDEHIEHYERMMVSNLGAGVQACYRGPRLYDTDRTKEMVKRTVKWFKEYRDILESDIIHSSSQRADGRDIDWLLHANPKLKHKGMLIVFNPLDVDVTRTIPINLYYTGLTKTAVIRKPEGNSEIYTLSRQYTIDVPVTVKAGGFTWLLVEAEEKR